MLCNKVELAIMATQLKCTIELNTISATTFDQCNKVETDRHGTSEEWSVLPTKHAHVLVRVLVMLLNRQPSDFSNLI